MELHNHLAAGVLPSNVTLHERFTILLLIFNF